MIIKNKKSLIGRDQLRQKLLSVVEAGYQSIILKNLLPAKIKRKGSLLIINNQALDLKKYLHIYLAGIGKCSSAAAGYLEKVLAKQLKAGLVIDVADNRLKKSGLVKVLKGDHPLPSEKNLQFTKQLLDFISKLDKKNDLLIFIVSGGGSSLFFAPEGIKVGDFIKLTNDLHHSGANIHELNIVRKHLSAVQGGKLAEKIFPQEILALYFSDVISETSNKNLETIASGPLYTDKHTSAEARQILIKYGLWQKYKDKIKFFSETLKDKKILRNVKQNLILTNEIGLLAMKEKASRFGFKPQILTDHYQGEANQAFLEIRKMAKKYPAKNLFLVGGEMTVRVKGKGKGGRNLQAVLASLKNLNSKEIFVSFASDGIDNTEYAGAIADSLAKTKIKDLKLALGDFLVTNNSFEFFKKTKDFLKTGSTGSNVADYLIYFRS